MSPTIFAFIFDIDFYAKNQFLELRREGSLCCITISELILHEAGARFGTKSYHKKRIYKIASENTYHCTIKASACDAAMISSGCKNNFFATQHVAMSQ